MTDPAPVAPVVLHPAADESSRQVATTSGTSRIRFCLSALARIWRHLPSIEDARKFVVNVVMIAAAALALVAIVNTALKPATVIDAIGVPKELEERGYTSAVVAQRLIDEITRIGASAATINNQMAFSSLPFENKIPKIETPVAGVSVAAFVAQLRDLIGIVDTRISGEVTIERALAATDKEAQPAPVLSLRLRIQDNGTVHVGEPAGKIDALLRPAALQLVERFDPYVAAAYYYVNDDFDNAQRMVQRLLDGGKEEDRRRAVNLNGLIALEQRHYEEAIAVFSGLIAAKPDAVAPLLNRAAARIAMGIAESNQDTAQSQFEQALADALGAVALTDANEPAKNKSRVLALGHTVAGEALLRMGDESKVKDAVDRFQRAITTNPKYARPYFLLGQMHHARNELADAAAALAHAVDVDPNNPDIYEVYTEWGDVLIDMGKVREAQKVFERAIAIDPKNANGYAAVGKIYLAQREWTKATDYFHKAIDANPSWGRFHYYLARALAGAGKPEPAIAAFERAASLDPLYALSFAGWGQALADAARAKDGSQAAALRGEAAAKLAKAAEIAPSESAVLKEVGKGYVALDEPARALEAYAAALALDGDAADDATLKEMERLRAATER